MTAKKKVSVTGNQYAVLDKAYNFFNQKLFDGKLPDCMILLHRKGKRSLGYYHPERFLNRDALKAKKTVKVDELSLNPDNFLGRNDTAILSRWYMKWRTSGNSTAPTNIQRMVTMIKSGEP